jgi:hypothetical protein
MKGTETYPPEVLQSTHADQCRSKQEERMASMKSPLSAEPAERVKAVPIRE